MRRLSLLLLASVGVFAITGCSFVNGFLNRGDDASAPEQDLSLDGVPLPSGEPAEAEDFPEPIVPVAPTAAAIAAELLPSIDPDTRVGEVTTSRRDPFAALVPGTPVVLELPEPPPDNSRSNGGSNSGSNTSGGGSSSGQTTPPPSGVNPPGTLSPIGSLPELPRPDLAEAVAVSGIVQIGDTPHAIVQAPGEPTTRYVTEGQRLSNGRILVKRIEIREGLEPRVILEENGIEVAVIVGTGTTTASAADPSAGEANAVTPVSSVSEVTTVSDLPALPPALAVPPTPEVLPSQG